MTDTPFSRLPHRNPQPVGNCDRRQVLRGLVAGGVFATALLDPSPLAASTVPYGLPGLFAEPAETWKSQLGKHFLAIAPGKPDVRIRLTEVHAESARSKNSKRPAGVRDEAVSLIFVSESDLDDGAYQLIAPERESADLFLHATRRGHLAQAKAMQVVLN